MGPSIVQADRKVAAVVSRRVRLWAHAPRGGQHDDEEEEVSLNVRAVA